MDAAIINSCIVSGEFDDEEIAVLLLMREGGKFDTAKTSFNLDAVSDQDCIDFFRFEREDLYSLKLELNIPDEFRSSNGSVFDGMEGLCILLRRLAYPCRYTDIKSIFGRSLTELSLAFNWMLDYIYDNFVHLFTNLDLCWLTGNDLRDFAQAVRRKGAPLHNVWGFIDGTVRPICRPSENQKVMWNGHYRVHGMIFQSVVAPNGMIVNLDGPWPGRRHDAGVLADSRLLTAIENKMEAIGGDYILYGDPAYPLSRYLEAPFRKTVGDLAQDQEDFNTDMSSCRECVEWTFGKIVRYFAFVDFTKNLRVLVQPVGKYYNVAALLTNCHTTLYSSQTSMYFGLNPPSLHEYLSNERNL